MWVCKSRHGEQKETATRSCLPFLCIPFCDTFCSRPANCSVKIYDFIINIYGLFTISARFCFFAAFLSEFIIGALINGIRLNRGPLWTAFPTRKKIDERTIQVRHSWLAGQTNWLSGVRIGGISDTGCYSVADRGQVLRAASRLRSFWIICTLISRLTLYSFYTLYGKHVS